MAGLRTSMAAGELTTKALTQAYLARIEAIDPELGSVLEINPDALETAERMDEERGAGNDRGPLHGIPVLIKDNIDTADRMRTTAGSLALGEVTPARDAFVVERIREAGAVILGKANLSEWANFRSVRATSGWRARGGQCRNPYAPERNPCGSSSGSAVAVSGVIGFVGIVVPHFVRLIGGPDHRFVLPASALVGAVVLLIADILARTSVAPAELPIGILMALIGAPVFLHLVLKRGWSG